MKVVKRFDAYNLAQMVMEHLDVKPSQIACVYEQSETDEDIEITFYIEVENE